ncbi:putative lipid II flippase FtsW [Methylocystis sp. MJC1]|jgi:cell division protein FtsW|uniref:FtsW/RodA/SpoVE family cell cycle protein n=1 Tax=Methylocystis sp. MJC1 TaxID=2654282 RepID=UPI0013EAA321|nr:putative peptidoglycan glycosyltransferase FtsW [Methylocystis sp. MJC1]KAF2989481.1 putative lipid II flippase FtsW [Methylocystis sp. MJC1]MBU6527929.1 cell division protein FtsW [Methylocystis sp. MJC1]UZX10849.1 putative lipid II flippase FtsW [Methylocystis sp. MJC1]
MISRAERTPISDWAWTIDRWLLAGIALLIVAGLVFGMAGSPPVAERLHLSTFHFVNRQVAYLLPALAVMIGASFLSPRHVRRAALVVFVVSLALVVATLFFGQEVKGARRWIFGIQPSEFLKPSFVVVVAWAFSEGARRKDVPGNWLALLLFPLTIGPLVLQPDFGQTMLISVVWAALFFMAGLHIIWVVGLGGLGASAALLAYKFAPHVRARVDAFLEPPPPVAGVPTNFQSETALESFKAGSWFGKGPGEGTVKRILPDSHTDFIFAVIGEEFGVIVCIVLAMVFAFIVVRGLFSAARNEDPFCRFATAGLVMLFGLQSCINMAVNVHLMPAKGMTLPFVSYGGSSLISLSLGMGFLLAVTRKRPRTRVLTEVAATSGPLPAAA